MPAAAIGAIWCQRSTAEVATSLAFQLLVATLRGRNSAMGRPSVVDWARDLGRPWLASHVLDSTQPPIQSVRSQLL